MKALAAAVMLCALACGAGCKGCSRDDGAGKGASADGASTDGGLASPAATSIPADVAVAVERPGEPNFTIDAKLLGAHAPDLHDPPWLGWKLRSLVPKWNANDLVDTVDDEGYRAPLLRAGESAGDTEPVLLLGPDGETRVIRVDPQKPITAHKGEARKDAGRIRHIAKIEFRSGDDTGVVGPAILLKVVNGKTESTWTRAELAKVKPIVLMSKDGDGERDAWNLHDLASSLVGPQAAVGEVVGEEGKALTISPKQWTDTTLVPVIRSNRRGRLKLVWLDPKTNEEDKDEAQLRGVTEIRMR